MRELDELTYQQIQTLCEAGDTLADDDDLEGALDRYEDALCLVPEPKTDWEAATWIFSAIGDCEFQLGAFSAAKDALQLAVVSPDGLGNPFVHLRLGQVHFETGDLDKAADDLTRAYMGAGAEIFEDVDPKYWEFLKTRILLPV